MLSELRAALGADKRRRPRRSSIEGQVTRSGAERHVERQRLRDGVRAARQVHEADVFANLGGMELKRRTGFNGAELIDEMDAPPE